MTTRLALSRLVAVLGENPHINSHDDSGVRVGGIHPKKIDGETTGYVSQ